MRIPTDAWFSIVGLLVSQPVLRRRGGLIIVIIIVIDIFNENYCKGHCSGGEIMTRKVKCHSKSNSFLAAAEQVCLQPVLEHRQRRGRRYVSSSQLLKSVTRTLQLCEGIRTSPDTSCRRLKTRKDVSLRTGLTPVSDRITRGRNAILGHVARLPDNIPTHQAMLRQVELSFGRPPDPTWKRPPGRPRRRFILCVWF